MGVSEKIQEMEAFQSFLPWRAAGEAKQGRRKEGWMDSRNRTRSPLVQAGRSEARTRLCRRPGQGKPQEIGESCEQEGKERRRRMRIVFSRAPRGSATIDWFPSNTQLFQEAGFPPRFRACIILECGASLVNLCECVIVREQPRWKPRPKVATNQELFRTDPFDISGQHRAH